VYTADLEYHGPAVHGVFSGDQLGTGEFNFLSSRKIVQRPFRFSGFLIVVASQDRIAAGDVQGALHAPRSSKRS
jgi:hypothetical protein